MPSTYSDKTTASQVATDVAAHIKDKVVLVTGVTANSLGSEFVLTISQFHPALLILAGRDAGRLQEMDRAVQGKAKTRLLILNLGSQAQIRKAADEVLRYEEAIDVLVNSAGIMAPAKYGTTSDGIESQFGINHVGHFLFTNLILPKMNRKGKSRPRVVNISSNGYQLGPVRFGDYNFQNGETYDDWRGYGQSKTANALFSLELARKSREGSFTPYTGLLSFSLHPGAIKTNLGGELSSDGLKRLVAMDHANGLIWPASGIPYKTLQEGTATYVYAAFHPELEGKEADNGRYMEDCKVMPLEEMHSWARDPIDARKLWALSEKLVGQAFA